MKIQEALEILEESIRVSSLKTGFGKVIPGTNYVDAHAPLPVFGTKWGRGVLVSSNGNLDAIIGPYGSSHAELKKHLTPGENTRGTFYYGYDIQNKALYFEYGSDRTFEFNNKVLTTIINSLKNSNGYFKGMVISS